MRPKTVHLTMGLSLAVASLLVCTRASAQELQLGSSGSLSSGFEAGGPLALRLARTRLRLGVDARLDESPEDIFEFGALAEVEPHSAFGLDARYARLVGEHFMLDGGVLGMLAPASLYGVGAGLTYRLPISKVAQVTFGPEADFFFLGTDLPAGTVIWQFRFQGGFRVDL